jgi:predicted aspartyl protease
MSRFADKATVRAETGNQVIMQTVGGKALADVGHAKSISAGKVVAFGVATAVMRDADSFGKGIDGLLGMSFLSRFNVRLSPTSVEMTATPLR